MPSQAQRDIDDEIAKVRARLRQLAAERIEIVAGVRELELPFTHAVSPASEPPRTGASEAITSASPAAEKVALFRRLFVGRADVFPVRWDNKMNGRSGYVGFNIHSLSGRNCSTNLARYAALAASFNLKHPFKREFVHTAWGGGLHNVRVIQSSMARRSRSAKLYTIALRVSRNGAE
jgi:hypothetical protein